MCRLCKILKNFLLSISLLTSAAMLAQEDKLMRADQLRSSNPELALQAMDSVIQHPQTKNDFSAWTIRAYIYYEIYKRTDKLKLNSALRDSILSSIKTSNDLKPDSDNTIANKRMIGGLSKGYLKIAKTLLEDSINYERSVIAFNRCKELNSQVDPNANYAAQDVEYYVAVGSVYSNIFNQDNKNVKAGDIAKLSLLKVIEIQPNNPSANLNLGLMYYNQAANLSKSLEYGADFTEIDAIQDNMIKLAKQSEQLIRNVYVNNPENLKAIEALYYIYRMLVDTPKFEEFKAKCKEKKIGLGDEQVTKPAEENSNNQQNKDK